MSLSGLSGLGFGYNFLFVCIETETEFNLEYLLVSDSFCTNLLNSNRLTEESYFSAVGY